jgi:diguanylate cyclase (GGDEF)-like protein/PAS domain S-box-containing protein
MTDSEKVLRALLVEDSPDDAELIELELRRNGFNISTLRVEDRESTARALGDCGWDIVLTDHAMPTFSAQGVMELLADCEAQIPCIVVSGAIGEEAAVALLKSGAVDFINKNRLNHLGPAVKRALAEAEERRARHAAEEALRESEARFRLIAENARDLISMTNMAGRFVYVSPSHEVVLGYSAQSLEGLGPLELVHPEDRERFGSWRAVDNFELRMRDAGGEYHWVEGSTSLVMWQGEPHLVSIARDISSQKEMTERLKQLAFFDPLSGLPNRTLLRDRLRQALAHAQRVGRAVGVMFVDFDNFKVLNDSLGHEFGDQVLQTASKVILECVRTEDTVARLGGDEFVVVLPAIDVPEDAARVAEKILQRISEPFELAGQEVALSASVGIALSDGLRYDIDDLLKHADLAMYLAKESGKGHFRFFTPRMDLQAVERLNLERDLRGALERNEFVLHYQPQLDLEELRVTGMEALVRWNHPTRGLMMPETFIPLAEETGLIRNLGELVLKEACRQTVAWQRSGLAINRIAVNLSAKQLQVPNLLETVAAALRESGLSPDCLELEITESATVGTSPEVLQLLLSLKELGVYLAIDDFGTGYSSLSYLKRLPMDTLKVDRNFVSGLASRGTGNEDAAILRAVVELGKNLHLRVVGEGIESEDQLRFLTGSGFDEGQGFLFSEPLPAVEAAHLLSNAHGWAQGPR